MGRAAGMPGSVSHVDDDDPLRLRSARFLNQSVQVVRVAAEQHDWAFQLEGCGSDYGIDGTPVARKPGRPEQLAGSASDLGGDWHDGDPRQHTVHGGIARTASKCLRQGYRTHRHPGAPSAGTVKVCTGPGVTRRKL